MEQRVCTIVGAGPGNGAAFARRFAGDGYRVALLARDQKRLRQLAHEIQGCIAVPCDVAEEDSLADALNTVEIELGPIQTLIYNAGNYVRGHVGDTDRAQLEHCFRINASGCLQAVHHVAKSMRKRGTGEIVVIGATASRRGAVGALPFATAKAGQRVMVESIARELGPDGVHVAYLVIDAVIDSPRMRALFACRSKEAFAQPDGIAQAVAALVAQPRSAWTFELDLRPHLERW